METRGALSSLGLNSPSTQSPSKPNPLLPGSPVAIGNGPQKKKKNTSVLDKENLVVFTSPGKQPLSPVISVSPVKPRPSSPLTPSKHQHLLQQKKPPQLNTPQRRFSVFADSDAEDERKRKRALELERELERERERERERKENQRLEALAMFDEHGFLQEEVETFPAGSFDFPQWVSTSEIAATWKDILKIDQIRSQKKFVYQPDKYDLKNHIEANRRINLGFIEVEDDKNIAVIIQDIARTFTRHMLFLDPEGKGRRTLFNILVNYSQYNPVVGYCQGMSYIAAIFLMHFSEEETFWSMASLLSSSNYMLNFYDEGLSELMVKSKVFMELLEAREPSLSSHLTTCGMDPLMYITPWFMRMFTSFDDWDLVLFTFGHAITNGISGMFCLALSFMDILKERLLQAKDLSQILPCLLYLPKDQVTKDAIQAALPNITVARETIEKIELDLKLKNRAGGKRQRAAEPPSEGQASKKTKLSRPSEDQTASLFDRLMTPVRKHLGIQRPSACPAPSASTPTLKPGPSSSAVKRISPRNLSPTTAVSFNEFSTPTPLRQRPSKALAVQEPGSSVKKPKKEKDQAQTPGLAQRKQQEESPPATEMEEKVSNGWDLRAQILSFEEEEKADC